MDSSGQNDHGPPGPLDERTLDRWHREISGSMRRPVRKVSPGSAPNATTREAAAKPHWSVRLETWFFRFAVVATIAGVLYLVVSTLRWIGVIR